MVVSHLLSQSPSMIYFGQTVGEDGSEDPGFGAPSRTSIFDYVGVPEHQKWMNNGKFDGALLSPAQRALRAYYIKLLNMAKLPTIAAGDYVATEVVDDSDKVVVFGRQLGQQKMVVASNFDADNARTVTIRLPKSWQGKYADILEGQQKLL